MKLTATGFRISKNGNIIPTIEKEAIKKYKYEGQMIKENGIYYFFSRRQSNTFVYLP